MPKCKTCLEWKKEANRHKKVAGELSIKLAAAYEELEILRESNAKMLLKIAEGRC